MVALVLTGTAIGWIWGYQSARRGIFPEMAVRNLIEWLRMEGVLPDRRDKRMQASTLRYGNATEYSRIGREWTTQLAKDVAEHGDSLRRELRERVIIPPSKVRLSTQRLADGNVTISAEYYGIKVNGLLLRGRGSAHCLVVYHQGHEGDPRSSAGFEQLSEDLLNEGCDVLAMSMLGLGLNAGPASYPTRSIYGIATVRLSPTDASRHGSYALFADPSAPKLSPVSLFVSGSYYIIKSLVARYRNVNLVGISGGGWYTVLLGATLTETKGAVSVAGSVPLALRIHGEEGDYEQVFADLWSYFDYSQLYLLGTLDENGRRTRKVHLVYNDRDSCCFSDPEASLVRKLYPGADGISVHVNRQVTHAIDVLQVLSLLRELR